MVIIGWLRPDEVRAETPVVEEPPPAGEEAGDADAGRVAVRALAKAGRAQVKAGEVAAGIGKLREAVKQSAGKGFEDDELASLHYYLGLGLAKDGQDDAGVVELREAVRLAPKDGDLRLELATLLQRNEQYDDARAAAEAALRLGLSEADDRAEAQALIVKARRARLHERLSIDATVGLSFDSNVLQGGAIQTIAGRSTGAAARAQLANRVLAPAQSRGVYDDLVVKYYSCQISGQVCPSQSSWDTPLTLNLAVEGQPYGGRRLELWAGYRFSQTVMMRYAGDVETNPAAVDHDAYNYQEHDVSLRLRAEPWRWLVVKVKAEGFANFSGLKQFTPFQGGVNGYVDLAFIETRRWRTLVTYKHNYRVSFDRTGDGDLDGNRDDVGLWQELRTDWFRGKLGYRFHSDQTGQLTTEVPLAFPTAADTALALENVLVPQRWCPETAGTPLPSGQVQVGCFQYVTPLSYLSHEAVLSYRFMLPKKFEIFGTARYEHRDYAGLYTATYKALRVPPPVLGVELVNAKINGATGLGAAQTDRHDNLLGVDVAVSKELPRGFTLELGYAFAADMSNVVNGLDNRSYTKHTAQLMAYYSF